MAEELFNPDGTLAHYGVKGMKWGVRRKARKDADEFARAKVFYGEGAGVRRRLVKAKVEERKKDPFYKQEFDARLSSQNMEKRANQAKRERGRKDVGNSIRKTARGVGHIARGNSQYASLAAAGVFAAAAAAHRNGVDRMLLDKGKRLIKDVSKSGAAQGGQAWLKQMGYI